MPLDHYVTLGRSGLRVSPLCLGTMTFGEDWGWGSDIETSTKVIDTYLDRGGNFLDTANIYTKGHSEKIIGGHLAERPGLRDKLVLATKCTGNMHPGDPNGGGGARKTLIRNVEDSLRRLQTDYIDLLWAHFWDKDTPIDETLRAVDDLERQGKVRYFGLSDHPAWVCAMAQYESQIKGYSSIIALQIEYSLLERSIEAELLPMARHLGMGVTPWSPLKGGVLTGKHTRDTKPKEGEARTAKKELTEHEYTVIDALIKVADESGHAPAQVALAWCQHQPGVTSSIIGARTLDQLESNLAAADVTLTDAQLKTLNDASQIRLAFPHDFLNGVRTVIQNGCTVNGDHRAQWDLSATDETRH